MVQISVYDTHQCISPSNLQVDAAFLIEIGCTSKVLKCLKMIG